MLYHGMRCDFCGVSADTFPPPEGWMQVIVERYEYPDATLNGEKLTGTPAKTTTVHICRSCQTYDTPTVNECLEGGRDLKDPVQVPRL